MKGISKDLIDKVLSAGLFYDTKRYRYIVKEQIFLNGNRRPAIYRIDRKKLGTMAAYNKDEYTVVWVGDFEKKEDE